MGEIRNQLKSQSLEAVNPDSFNSVGGRVFPDAPSLADQIDLAQIVSAWSAVHAPTFGNPIGQSSITAQGAGQGGEAEVTVLSAEKSEVYRVQAVALQNGGGAAPIVAKVLIGDCPITMDLTGAPSTSTPFPLTQPVFVDLNSPLKFAVLSGTATDALLIVNAIKVSQ
tara:strand:+ start:189 stop:692 length:504 start_codon:yes stop_codon:yes gene_type:complete